MLKIGKIYRLKTPNISHLHGHNARLLNGSLFDDSIFSEMDRIAQGEIIFYLGTHTRWSSAHDQRRATDRHKFIRGKDGRIYLFFDSLYAILNSDSENYFEQLVP